MKTTFAECTKCKLYTLVDNDTLFCSTCVCAPESELATIARILSQILEELKTTNKNLIELDITMDAVKQEISAR